MQRLTTPSRRNGYFTLEAIAAVMLVAALATGLAVASNLRQRNAVKLVNQRAALVIAQQTLTNLQTRKPPPQGDSDTQIHVERTGTRVGSEEWVEVSVVHQGRRASLVGLVPAGGTP